MARVELGGLIKVLSYPTSGRSEEGDRSDGYGKGYNCSYEL
jgi:hypothetical protein